MQDSSSKTLVDQIPDALSATTSEQTFALWGVDDVAYIRPVDAHSTILWVVCAADGTVLGTLPDRAVAFAAATQNDRTPLSVH
jgi:hypothetical protein